MTPKRLTVETCDLILPGKPQVLSGTVVYEACFRYYLAHVRTQRPGFSTTKALGAVSVLPVIQIRGLSLSPKGG